MGIKLKAGRKIKLDFCFPFGKQIQHFPREQEGFPRSHGAEEPKDDTQIFLAKLGTMQALSCILLALGQHKTYH